jgi:RNA polymerase sigma-70 factor (ECF subfamily)
MTMEHDSVTHLLAAVRAGNAARQGELLVRYERWLRVLAHVQIESRFNGKFDTEDIVQQTLLEAVRALPQFRGTTEAELLAWLRQVLAHVLAHEVRRWGGTLKRDLGREVPLEQSIAESSRRLRDVVAAPGPSPSRCASEHEQELLLAEALARLPEDYRQVVLLRHIEGLSHEEAARRMNRTPGAVRMLWVRALARLKELADALDSGTRGSPPIDRGAAGR